MAVLLGLSLPLQLCGVASQTTLGIAEGRFLVNGQPTFLLGASYYGGLGAPPEFVRQDFDDLVAAGFNWVRVWATWTFFDHDVSAVDSTGGPREPYLSALKALLDEADQRGMIVDVTVTHARERPGQQTVLGSLEAHRRAMETLARELKPWRNVYFDLSNERDVRDQRYVSLGDLATLAAAVRAIDPERLLTASCTGELTKEDLREQLTVAALDFITPHRPRNSESARACRARTEQAIAWMRELGRVVPLHYQEPFRRGYSRGWEPTVDDFLTDLHGAREGGAAGWCFHNGDSRFAPEQRPRRSFDLRPAEGRLMAQLDEVEREFVARAR